MAEKFPGAFLENSWQGEATEIVALIPRSHRMRREAQAKTGNDGKIYCRKFFGRNECHVPGSVCGPRATLGARISRKKTVSTVSLARSPRLFPGIAPKFLQRQRFFVWCVLVTRVHLPGDAILRGGFSYTTKEGQ